MFDRMGGHHPWQVAVPSDGYLTVVAWCATREQAEVDAERHNAPVEVQGEGG